MVAGHTDAAIAKRLGMSARTVSTHIKRSSELFNSHSRVQLAYPPAQSGILEDVPT
ncbi:LuxR C-terminal-related transcriptional regulator [Streptomyces violascens]|uniref:LuxR C-terminal-related transcriptional regulator n=1 Tax=Streptomyces violascens TaxID=67381 RepID=UPI003646B5DD